MKSFRRIFVCSVCLLATASLFAQKKQINLTFAEKEEAAQLIMDEDAFNRGLSDFDICARVGQADATKAELNALQHSQVREWTQAEIDTLTKSAEILEAYLSAKGYSIPCPSEVIMIKTTMAEEGNSGAYTRENQIYIGQDALRPRKDKTGKKTAAPTAASLCPLLAHELFHVLTRNDRKFRTEMYKTIQFNCIDKEIKFPKDIWSMHISNPDISRYDSYATFTIKGEPKNCTMILLANRPYEGGSFFNYLKVALIPLDGEFKPVQEEGKTVVYGLEDAEDFLDKVGRNTQYVINPEECLADNFAIAVTSSEASLASLPNPEIITRISEILSGTK